MTLMSESANVRSIAALTDFRAALTTFGDEAKDALAAIETEIRRCADWLHDQLIYWKAEVRRSEDELHQAKQELARRRLMKVGDRPLDCTEQEKAVRRAQARLEHAEEQEEKTRTWIRDLPRVITDYEGRARQLQSLVEGELPRACALLERKAEALEAYVAMQAPSREAPSVAAQPPEPAPVPERKQP